MMINSGILRPTSINLNTNRSIHPFLYPANRPSVTPMTTIAINVQTVTNNVERAPIIIRVNKSLHNHQFLINATN